MERNVSGNRKGKGCAFAEFAFDPDIPVHQLEIFFHDAQAQADTVEFAVTAVLDLLELIEDSIEIFGPDSDPRIRHAKLNAIFTGQLAHSPLDASLWSKLEGIADQVLENLLDFNRIGCKWRNTLLDIPPDLEMVIAVDLFDVGPGVSDNFAHFDL